MEYAVLRVLGDAVDPGLIPIIYASPELVFLGLGIIGVGAALALKLFYKKKKKGK